MILHNLKICGITTRETAQFCAACGVEALGAVFFAKSPRNVTPQQARAIFEGLPAHVARVGVFVDMPLEEMLSTARAAALDTVQLHGSEPAETVAAALAAGFHVIKVLKTTGAALVDAARAVPAEAGILVECGKGTLPGGNGAVWNWADAAPLAAVRPFALAGGLTPDNLSEAARLSQATAWDLSSGVECAPGVKDHGAIRRLAENWRLPPPTRTPFWKALSPLKTAHGA